MSYYIASDLDTHWIDTVKRVPLPGGARFLLNGASFGLKHL